ncbi:MAG: ParA family protein [Clostridiales Family XIII bacterium]|jgi:chromosome partitioning protein|nr:ParA family protein [Clostridiales Family XIII bacterium]
MSITYAVANQKGGCGKTSLTLNLGASLARMGYKVCLCDVDPQANMTMAMGCPQPDELPVTLPHVIRAIIDNGGRTENSELLQKREYILRAQDMDFVPSSIELTGTENILVNTISRENILKKFVAHIKDDYDFVLMDCMPSLNFVTVNALNAADRVLIPMQPQFFSAKGLELLLSTIANVRENLNPNLVIEGALITMFDGRLNFHREVLNIVKNAYGDHFRIFETKIPVSVRVTETQAMGRSIFEHDPKGKIAEAYSAFAREAIANG